MKFDTPNPKPDVDQDGNLDRSYAAFLTALRDGVVLRSQHGTTAQRPTKQVEIGLPYYDTTLGKPIWINSVGPIVWHDATGAVV